ncbi:MAG TPA: copper-containing nitrite reductase [Nitriliruptorales bacterium]|nr:copper-containing nitrite reductase [Nitriliruptorales bacterium]
MTELRTRPPDPQAPPIRRADENLGTGRGVALLVAAVALSVTASLIATASVGATVAAPAGPASPATGPAAEPATDAQPVTAERISRDPTDVGEPVGSRAPTTVTVELETTEVRGQLADGTAYDYWSFNGTVPGPMMRARVGDTIELTLRNSPDAVNTHSIDLHAVTGPGGGAVVTQVAPGEEKTLSFKAVNPGVYVYHCATPHIPSHIANGMYGVVVVEPEGGLPPVDREFYVMQGEIYTAQERGVEGVLQYDGAAMVDEDPTYVVFNGAVNGLTGEHAMHAQVGERVRLFVGNGGPNLVSSFHVIGEIFDRVHHQGASEADSNVQTTLIPAGGATWVEFTLDQPGDYLLVDHSITRTIDKGALAVLTVEGDHDPAIYDGEFPQADPQAAASDGHGQASTEPTGAYAPGDTIAISMSEFAYSPDHLDLPAGTYTFVVTNDGAVAHEWVLGANGANDDNRAGTRRLARGEAQRVEVTLEPGSYEYGCHIPGHYQAGMRGTLSVTG